MVMRLLLKIKNDMKIIKVVKMHAVIKFNVTIVVFLLYFMYYQWLLSKNKISLYQHDYFY